jgi:hypothetical protein
MTSSKRSVSAPSRDRLAGWELGRVVTLASRSQEETDRKAAHEPAEVRGKTNPRTPKIENGLKDNDGDNVL